MEISDALTRKTVIGHLPPVASLSLSILEPALGKSYRIVHVCVIFLPSMSTTD